jgi:VWFA-related protein
MPVQRKAAWLMRIGCLTTAATIVLAADQTPPTPQTQRPGQQPTFRATTDAIVLDVTVRDSKGIFVPNLRQDQFEVFEDGVKQTLTYFDYIVGGASMTGTAVMSAPRSMPGVIVPTKRQVAHTSGRVFIMFIDDLHFEPSETSNVRALMRQIRDQLINENDLLAIVSSGFSSIAMNPGYDYGRKRINEAIEKTMGSAMTIREIIEAAQTAEGPAGLRYMAHTAMKTVHSLLEQISSINDRRKAFLYISAGYDFNPYEDSRLKHEQERYGAYRPSSDNASLASGQAPEPQSYYTNPFTKSGTTFAEADLVSDMGELIRAANRANATFYALDPRGLVAGPPINSNLSVNEFREHLTTQINSLLAISEGTGGFAAVNTNDYKKALERINNETSDYYLLGYRTNNPDPLKVSRRIEIKAKVPDVTLLYRTQVTFARPSRTPGK